MSHCNVSPAHAAGKPPVRLELVEGLEDLALFVAELEGRLTRNEISTAMRKLGALRSTVIQLQEVV